MTRTTATTQRRFAKRSAGLNMRFVPIKSTEQQFVLSLHWARDLLVGPRTALINQIRGSLSEHGIVVGLGAGQLRQALPEILEDGDNRLPDLARELLADLDARLRELDAHVEHYDRRIEALAREMEPAQRLMWIEGIGPLTATAMIASAVRVHGRPLPLDLGA